MEIKRQSIFVMDLTVNETIDRLFEVAVKPNPIVQISNSKRETKR